MRSDPARCGGVGDSGQLGTGDAAGDGGEPDRVQTVLEALHTDVITRRGQRGGCRTVDQLAAQVLVFEDLTELLDAPVLDQELQAGLGAKPAVAVVAEDRDDGLPDVRDLVERDPGTDPLREHRVGRQAAADPEVESGAVLGMVDTDERDVVDLVGDVLQAGDRGLELAGQVRVLRVADVAADDLVDRGSGVEDLVERLPGERRAQDDAGAVAAGLGGLESDGLEPAEDLRDVADVDPVVLDVLAVGEISGVAAELGRELTDGAQLLGGQGATVAPHPEHEVLGLEDVDVVVTGPGAVVALGALGVETPPAHPAPQILLVDGVETLLGVDVLDPGPDVERVVVLLDLLVGVLRFAVAERPLTFCPALYGTRAARGGFPGASVVDVMMLLSDGSSRAALGMCRWHPKSPEK